MLIVESDGLLIVFIHIPKTAGTTLRQILESSLQIYFSDLKKIKAKIVCYDYWSVSNGIDLAHVPLRFFPDYYPPDSNWIQTRGVKSPTSRIINRCNPRGFKPKLDQAKFTTLTCVRNPYARIYSAYCWHSKQKGLSSSPDEFKLFLISKLSEIVMEHNKSFQLGLPPSSEYIHFIPMWMMVSDQDGILKVDQIIRQEEFDQQVLSLLNKLGLPIPKQYSSAHCTKKTPPEPYGYIKHYNQETLELIEKLYQKDFEVFGYRKLGYQPKT